MMRKGKLSYILILCVKVFGKLERRQKASNCREGTARTYRDKSLSFAIQGGEHGSSTEVKYSRKTRPCGRAYKSRGNVSRSVFEGVGRICWHDPLNDLSVRARYHLHSARYSRTYCRCDPHAPGLFRSGERCARGHGDAGRQYGDSALGGGENFHFHDRPRTGDPGTHRGGTPASA